MLDVKEFLNKKLEEHGTDFHNNLAEIMQEYAEEYHKNKGRELPNNIIDRGELKSKYKDFLTVGKLKERLQKTELSDDAVVLIQRVEDTYYQNNGWDVFLKEGCHYYSVVRMNKKMQEEIERRARGEEPKYPKIDDPNKYIVELDDSMKEQYHPAWCAVGYKDEEFLFIDLHY